MGEFEIVPLKNQDVNIWEEFLRKTANNSFFATYDYISSFGNESFFLIKRNKAEIVSALPFVIQRLVPVVGKFMEICRVETEVLILNTYSTEESLNIKKEMFQKLIDHLKTRFVATLYITTKIRSNDAEIYQALGFETNKCGTYLINLENDIDSIYRNFSKGHKSAVQKAIKCGVDVSVYKNEQAKDHIFEFLETQKKLYERRQKTLSVLYLKSEGFLNTILSSKYHDVYVTIASYNNQTAATAIFVSYNDTIYYYAGNSNYDLVRESQAANFLQFEMIKFAQSAGYKYYDFGGAEIDPEPENELYGVTLFKKNFGGYLETYDCGKIIINKRVNDIVKVISKLQNNKFVSLIYKFLKK